MTGEKKIMLNCQEVLSRVSEYDIFRYYIGHDFKVNTLMRSPFHRDENPSFIVGNRSGSLYFFDFSDSSIRGKVIDFVMRLFSLSLYDARVRIDSDFGLGFVGSSKPVRKAPIYEQPKFTKDKPAIIQVKTKKFTKEGLAYWNGYHQDISDLKADNVYQVGEVWIDKRKWGFPANEPVFGYLFQEHYWKIYRPFAPLRKDKWRSNTPIDMVDGLEMIHNCEASVVTKSKKDKMVLRKVFPCTCAVQNESLVALNEETVTHLRENSKVVYCNFDSDPPGKENSFSVTKEFGFKHINVPDRYYKDRKIKDFAELARQDGLEAIVTHFKNKGLL